MQTPVLPFGTAMALAERNLRGPLVRILSEERLAAGAWFTLNALGLRGVTPRGELIRLLGTSGYDEEAAQHLLSGLLTDGLVERSQRGLRLTATGRVRFEAVGGRIATASRRIFSLFDESQVETTRALLQQIAEVDPATIEAAAFPDAPKVTPTA